VHQRYVELTDKNMSMLDKYKELVEMALTHAKLPPEHYHLEATKLHMRTDSHRAAMAANTRAAMAHERQQTVQVFTRPARHRRHPLPTAARRNASSQRRTASTPGRRRGHRHRHHGLRRHGLRHGRGSGGAPEAGNMPSLCRGTRRLHEVLDAPTIAALERNLAPDHWSSLSPLLSCTDEAEFRRHINLLSTAFSRLPEEDQARFRAGLRESVPFAAQLQLTQLLGSYGLRIH